MSRPDVAARRRRVPRFTRAERVTHWVNAALWFVCIATGAMFRFGIGQSLITDRGLARNIHVIAGLGILVVFLVAVVGRWGAALRRDLGRFNRWSRDDMRWLRTFGGDRKVRLGKFNPGQKLNATFIGAAARDPRRHRLDHEVEPAVLHRPPHRRRLRARLVRAVRRASASSATSSWRSATARRSRAWSAAP